MIWKSSLCLLACLSTHALATVNSPAQERASAVAEGVLPGQYETRGTRFFTDLRISDWASGRFTVLSGNIVYEKYAFPFEAELSWKASGHYSATGKFKISYDDGSTCFHEIRAELYPSGTEGLAFFLRHYAPESVYIEKLPGGACPSHDDPYVWSRHPEAYVRTGD